MRAPSTASDATARPETISIVIPALNEADELPETVRRARLNPDVTEVIVVDGGSQDNTTALAAQLGCRVLEGVCGRGAQMRLGAQHATADVVLFLHADTWLPPNAGQAARACLQDRRIVGGGFWKVFRGGSWLLRGSRARCALRLFCGSLILGDQAIFIRREVLERIGGVPDMPLMEEFELCRRLRQQGQLVLARATVSTSPRRFQKLGVWRTYWRMARVTLGYWVGVSPDRLRRIYEQQ